VWSTTTPMPMMPVLSFSLLNVYSARTGDMTGPRVNRSSRSIRFRGSLLEGSIIVGRLIYNISSPRFSSVPQIDAHVYICFKNVSKR